MQVCRGLAAFAVVFAHLHNVEAKYFHTQLFAWAQFGVLGVDMFFVISGIVIAVVTAGHFGQVRYAGRFLTHRLLRIYPVYWFYSLVILLLILINPHLVRAGAEHAIDMVGSITLFPTGRVFLLLQGWTLTFEICFYLAIALLLLLPARVMPFALTAWATAVIGRAVIGLTPPNEAAFLLTNPLILEFLVGVLLFYLLRRSRLHPAWGVGLVALSFVWLTAVVVCTARWYGFDQLPIENDWWPRTEAYGPFAVLFLAGSMELERTKLIRFARPFELLGDWSYSIYLSHLLVLELIGRLLAPRLHDSWIGIVAAAAVSLPAIALTGWLSFRWLEQPLIRLMHRKPATA